MNVQGQVTTEPTASVELPIEIGRIRLSAEELRYQFVAAGLNQVSFHRMTGVSAPAISLWLSGQRLVPAWVGSWLAMFHSLNAKQRARIWPEMTNRKLQEWARGK
jgi:hypothetical protein